MGLILEKHQIDKLRRTYERGGGSERQLAQVVLLSAEGWPQSKIAKALNLDIQTVVSHLQDYLKPIKHAKKGLLKYQLTPDQTAELVAHIEKNPHLSIPKIVEHIKEHYKGKWSESAVQLFLKKNSFLYRSTQVLDREVITKTGSKKPIYRSFCGWFKKAPTDSDNATPRTTSAHKAR